MKYLFCKKLAACLCMKPSTSPPPEPPLLHTKRQDAAAGNQNNNSADYADSTAENESVKKLLTEIRDLLKTEVHTDEVHSFKEQKKSKVRRDWMLAAAVVDRICAIIFSIVIIGGTLAFIIAVTNHQSSFDS